MDTQRLFTFLLTVPAVLMALTLHEVSHGYAAYKLGDSTARNFGRLSLNPLKHFDPIGTLCLLFFHFGWARPVPVNSRNFKKPRRDMALVAFAGPLCNLILGVLSIFFVLLFDKFYAMAKVNEASNFVVQLCLWVGIFFVICSQINISLAIFNLLPIPPLDGSRILSLVLPAKASYTLMQYERYIALGLMLLILFDSSPIGFHLVSQLISLVYNGLFQLLYTILPFLH